MNFNLRAKDLSTVAIYSVLFFVLMIVIGFLGFIPIFIPLLAALAPLFGGLIFMLFLTRVNQFGMVSLLGLVNGLLMFVAGMGYWVVLTGAFFGLLADLLLKGSNYQNLKAGVIGHALFSLWVVGNFLPFYLSRQSYFAMISEGYGQEYANALAKIMPYWLLPILALASIVCGYIGAKIGATLLNKQLARAGIV
ncbi:MptD family putative ECF transporter S component [Vibrio sonorensis]|uniref:MptD family putative ECF transporter S component n=1 Tax=Vibrio sonorensis TaxID=1004316 RepID=UPI0008D9200D|nr:MptD family putative ECF transporter S component [Vibrio sonorensis]